MSFKARLKRLEARRPGGDGPFYLLLQYEDETEEQARAAYPELAFPARVEDACIWYIHRQGSRPAVRTPEDQPGYDPRGLRAVLRDIDGKTATVGAWKEQAGRSRRGQTIGAS